MRTSLAFRRMPDLALSVPVALREGARLWLGALALKVGSVALVGLILHPSRLPDAARLWDLPAVWLGKDAHWYLGIAQGGYIQPIQAAFFPGYPLAERLVIALTDAPGLVAGTLVSVIALLGACVALADLSNRVDGDASGLTTRLWLILPAAIFLVMAYSDSLALALIAGTLASAERRWWHLAAVCGLLAAVTRPVGVLLVPVLALLWWRQGAERRWTGAIASLAPFAGVLLWSGACALVYHDPFAWLHAQAFFGRGGITVTGPLLAAQQLAAAPFGSVTQLRLLLDDAPLALAVWGCVVAWRRLPAPYALWSTLVTTQILLTPVTDALYPHAYPSAARYLLAAFPLLWLLAPWLEAHPVMAQRLALAGAITQFALLAYLARGGWFV